MAAKFDKAASFYDSLLVRISAYPVRQQILRFIQKYIKDNFRILDIACGAGNFLGKFAKLKMGLELFGTDESRNMLKLARRKFKNKNINFVLGKAENLVFKDEQFHLITIIDSFSCFKNQEKVMQECRRTLLPNGHLIIATPSVDQPLSKLFLKTSKWLYTEKSPKYPSLQEIKTLGENSGFQLIEKELKNLPLLPLFKYWLIVFEKQTNHCKII